LNISTRETREGEREPNPGGNIQFCCCIGKHTHSKTVDQRVECALARNEIIKGILLPPLILRKKRGNGIGIQ